MPRTNKKLDEAIKKAKKTKHDVAIEERLIGCSKKEASHIHYIGDLVERILQGEFGAVIKALTAGRISQELHSAKHSGLSSDRVLGRIEMAENLWNDLEQFVLDRDKLALEANDETRQPEFINYPP